MLQVQLDEEEFGAVGARLEAAAATSDEGSEGVVGVRQDEARRRFIHPGDLAALLVDRLEVSAPKGSVTMEAWTQTRGSRGLAG